MLAKLKRRAADQPGRFPVGSRPIGRRAAALSGFEQRLEQLVRLGRAPGFQQQPRHDLHDIVGRVQSLERSVIACAEPIEEVRLANLILGVTGDSERPEGRAMGRWEPIGAARSG